MQSGECVGRGALLVTSLAVMTEEALVEKDLLVTS